MLILAPSPTRLISPSFRDSLPCRIALQYERSSSFLLRPRNLNHDNIGFRDFGLINQPMLAKQGWRLLTNPDSLCAKMLTFWDSYVLPLFPMHFLFLFITSPPESCNNTCDLFACLFGQSKTSHCICRNCLSFCMSFWTV